MTYSNAAIMTTAFRPRWMAITVASTALTTEAHPLMAQAQGTRLRARSLKRASLLPNGVSAFRFADAGIYDVEPLAVLGEAIAPYSCDN